MIIGTGTDMVEIARIENTLMRFGPAFCDRCFTEAEQDSARKRRSGGTEAARYAKLFAAKEATVKALGTGFGAEAGWHDIAVSRNDQGRPQITLSGAALETLKAQLPPQTDAVIHLSLSDEKHYALAFVVIEGQPVQKAA